MHDINEYIFIIKETEINILYRIQREIYFVDNLKVYILLNNDIISFEKIIFNIV